MGGRSRSSSRRKTRGSKACDAAPAAAEEISIGGGRRGARTKIPTTPHTPPDDTVPQSLVSPGEELESPSGGGRGGVRRGGRGGVRRGGGGAVGASGSGSGEGGKRKGGKGESGANPDLIPNPDAGKKGKKGKTKKKSAKAKQVRWRGGGVGASAGRVVCSVCVCVFGGGSNVCNM